MYEGLSLRELCAEIIKEKAALEAVEYQKKIVDEKVDALELKIHDIMLESEIERISVDGYTFRPDVKIRASIWAEMQEKAFRVFPKHGLGGLIKKTINAQTLSATTRELLEQNEGKLPKWMLPYVNIYRAKKVSMRKDAR
jgi:hypothetical protein